MAERGDDLRSEWTSAGEDNGMSATQNEWVEADAWHCVFEAQKDWRRRDAPSWGARARAIAGNLAGPPSYIAMVRERIGRFLADKDQSERRGIADGPRQRDPGRRIVA